MGGAIEETRPAKNRCVELGDMHTGCVLLLFDFTCVPMFEIFSQKKTK